MELLDRYLKAVKFWLPSEQKQDIIAELSEDLHSQIEDRESDLGRPLNDAEVDAILKKVGPPMLVAQRFLPPRYLIGTALFPTWGAIPTGSRAVHRSTSLAWYVMLPAVEGDGSLAPSDFRGKHHHGARGLALAAEESLGARLSRDR